MREASKPTISPHERRGPVEIRWTSDGDPDDVVAPYPRKFDDERITVHIERMDDGLIWMALYPTSVGSAAWGDHERVVMWFEAKRKGELEWRVSPAGY